ncbi:MAG: hypothetical protein IKD68_00940 [Solobacterium sp.]|nr:hypothetical protein [Solobacterium sp.]
MKRNPGKQILNRLKAAILALLLSAGCTVRTAGNETVVPAEETASPSAITETIPQEETPRTEPGSDYEDTLNLNEKELALNRYLNTYIKEADALYNDREVYGVAGWDKEEARNSRLYQFCLALPKGAELHTHEFMFLPFERYIETIRKDAYIVMEGENEGRVYAANNPARPENAVLLDDAISSGRLSMEDLEELLTLSGKEKKDGLWDTLSKGFVSSGGLFTDNNLITRLFVESFRYAQEIGVDLVEVRINRRNKEDALAYLEEIRGAYYSVRKEYPDFRVRVIGTSGKNSRYPMESGIETLRMFMGLSKEFKDEFDPDHPEEFIIGLDLVNEEDKSKPLQEYLDFLLSDEVQNSGLKLFLHCGESLRPDNTSVIDAYAVNTYRAGHGFNLYRFPAVMEAYKEKNITLEICPISNLSLGYVHDLRLHPAFYYIEQKVPVAVCSDDGLFMTPYPLVDDYYSAILCWGLNLRDIRDICERSIKAGGLSEEETEFLAKEWQKKWDSFVEEELKKAQASESSFSGGQSSAG